MNAFRYMSELLENPQALYSPLDETSRIQLELPEYLTYVDGAGAKGGIRTTSEKLAGWTNAQVVDAIKYTMAYPKRIEVCSSYTLPANERRRLEHLGVTIFTTHKPQATYSSEVVRLTLQDTHVRATVLVLEALRKL